MSDFFLLARQALRGGWRIPQVVMRQVRRTQWRVAGRCCWSEDVVLQLMRRRLVVFMRRFHRVVLLHRYRETGLVDDEPQSQDYEAQGNRSVLLLKDKSCRAVTSLPIGITMFQLRRVFPLPLIEEGAPPTKSPHATSCHFWMESRDWSSSAQAPPCHSGAAWMWLRPQNTGIQHLQLTTRCSVVTMTTEEAGWINTLTCEQVLYDATQLTRAKSCKTLKKTH